MKNRLIPILSIALIFGNAFIARGTTTLSSTGTFNTTAPTDNRKLVASGGAVLNGVNVGKGAGNLQYNVAIGIGTIDSASNSGNYQTAVGSYALQINTSGWGNTALGHVALQNNTSGAVNTAAGVQSLLGNSTGSENSAFGSRSMVANTSGSYNSAFGSNAFDSNTTGNQNTGIGTAALSENTTGSYNVGVGMHTLYYNTFGQSNVAIGNNAGMLTMSGAGLNGVSECIYIGVNSRGSSNSDYNSIVIGTNAVGEGVNTTVIGNLATSKTHLYGQTVSESLQVNGSTVLSGSVTLAVPQGDISMGNYQ